jgi:hypothetical protein
VVSEGQKLSPVPSAVANPIVDAHNQHGGGADSEEEKH